MSSACNRRGIYIRDAFCVRVLLWLSHFDSTLLFRFILLLYTPFFLPLSRAFFGECFRLYIYLRYGDLAITAGFQEGRLVFDNHAIHASIFVLRYFLHYYSAYAGGELGYGMSMWSSGAAKCIYIKFYTTSVGSTRVNEGIAPSY